MDQLGYMKVAAAIPSLQVADCEYNAQQIIALIHRAAKQGVEVTVFPELSLTGYTCADLFLQPTLLRAAENALEHILQETSTLATAAIIGLPLTSGGMTYNCAVCLSQGEILGVVPKSFIPNYSEFYEARWFASGISVSDNFIVLCGQEVPFGTDILFRINGVACGIEICEDLWVPQPPSSELAVGGAKVIFNLSASPEQIGKFDYLQTLVCQQSARTRTGYVYVSSGFGESSTDLVFAGNVLIADQGSLIACGERFSLEEQLLTAEIDTEQITTDRQRSTTFHAVSNDTEYTVSECTFIPNKSTFERTISPTPFVPEQEVARDRCCEEVFAMQSCALAKRLIHTGCRKVILGLSGGLDSTLALLATVRTFDRLNFDRQGIIGITMPGFGTTDRTYHNAVDLMTLLKITQREISIQDACHQHFSDIGLPLDDRSTTYENCQARERTQILMDVANKEGGLVIGTGDLSELALGWATYNGDQMSMYGINCSIPKTLIRPLVGWAAKQEEKPLQRILLDITATPVSPELLPADADGTITQKTEDLVGPYELHDFFLYHFIRRGCSPTKILFLAEHAFKKRYSRAVILQWMHTFFRRFFAQQFKRSALPDGPKIGSVSLSPRGDWKMPSDVSATIWLQEIQNLSPKKPL
ncbi:MAG: NAD(+) synthase [Alistipes sp.]